MQRSGERKEVAGMGRLKRDKSVEAAIARFNKQVGKFLDKRPEDAEAEAVCKAAGGVIEKLERFIAWQQAVIEQKERQAGERSQKGASARFETADEFQKAVDAYFNECDMEGKLYSEVGMAVSLGVTLSCLDQWWRGTKCPYLQEPVRMAYLRIAEQICTDSRYNERQMVSYRIFLLKQEKLCGYQDKVEAKSDLNVSVKMGQNMEESDFA